MKHSVEYFFRKFLPNLEKRLFEVAIFDQICKMLRTCKKGMGRASVTYIQDERLPMGSRVDVRAPSLTAAVTKLNYQNAGRLRCLQMQQ